MSGKFVFMLIVLWPLGGALANPTEPVPGEISERITCRGDAEQSYALYLPADYHPDKSWPLLLAFDPAGRGLPPVQRFQPAAEAHGYILAGSNNSRNGPFEPGFRSADALLNDLTERFSVDRNRIYLAGFSGGARLVTMMGLLTKWVAGVVACGAGFPVHMEPRKIGFALIGVVGTADMNHIEVRDLTRVLSEKFESTSRLLVFQGEHDWPPPDMLVKALDWLEIQAIKRHLRDPDPQLVERLFQRDLETVEALLAAGELPEADAGYRDLLQDYEGLVDLADVKERSSDLAGRPGFRDALKSRKKLENSESREIEKYRRRLEEVFSDNSRSPSWWAGESIRLDGLKDDAVNPKVRDMWIRVSDFLKRLPLERSWVEEDVDVALRFARIAAAVQPESLHAQYGLARAAAAAGRNREAMEALNRSVGLGLRRREALTEQPAFEKLRDETAFQQLLDRISMSR